MDKLIFDKAMEVVEQLNRHGVQYKVFGGMGINFQGVIRNTEDLDFFVKPTIENIERMKLALKAVWDDPAIDEISTEELCGDYPSVAYGPPDETIGLDILTRLGELYNYDNVEAEVVPVGDVMVHVATPSMLYRMKRDTVRLQDKADALRLRQAFNLEDE
jgi:hypothetical protein